ncbi:pilus assembly protein PilM [Candidatus Woesebacteria bacterium]|nr:pilus assembly protein PilM [Candidatus Woesebacteria bacterium]QQG47945.1 MAG: pilus assembly protein PilM [Candidatus Woesebacteria bacterium]
MYKKNFVSISFFDKDIQVAELDSSKKKVLKEGSILLPEGIIQNSKIINEESLAKVVSLGLKKLDIKEKSVGIVIHELTTFNKLLKIPKLSDKELDEAVRFRFQEFYPDTNQEMVLDWKIVGDLGSQYEILALAVPLDILKSFIDPLESIGLLPLVVETPSVSVLRLCDKQTVKLIIYKGSEKTLLTFAEGPKIVATSVVSSDSPDGFIVNTCDQIIKHYSNLSLEKIYIAGVGITQNFISLLSETFKKPIEAIKIHDIKNKSESDLQKYMIPFSLALHDPTEPKDEFSINLLPPNWVKKYEDIRSSNEIWTLTLISSVVIWACFFASVIAFALLASEQVNLQKEKEKTVSSLLPQDIVAQIQEINFLSEKVIKIKSASDDPNSVVNKINKLKPDDVQISGYHIDFDEAKINLTGKSTNLASLIKFKHDLESDPDFSGVDVPLSSLGSQTNLNFNMSFKYKTGAQIQTPGKINIQ